MNIIKCLRSISVAVIVASFASSALAADDVGFPSRIEKQTKAVEEARMAKEINLGELKSLKKEIKAIKALYKRYWKDKKISDTEAKTLESKLNNSDVNLFRKKYD